MQFLRWESFIQNITMSPSSETFQEQVENIPAPPRAVNPLSYTKSSCYVHHRVLPNRKKKTNVTARDVHDVRNVWKGYGAQIGRAHV